MMDVLAIHVSSPILSLALSFNKKNRPAFPSVPNNKNKNPSFTRNPKDTPAHKTNSPSLPAYFLLLPSSS